MSILKKHVFMVCPFARKNGKMRPCHLVDIYMFCSCNVESAYD